MNDIAGIIRKYFNMLPFERRQHLCDVIVKPVDAIDAEVSSPDLATSFRDIAKAAAIDAAVAFVISLLGVGVLVLSSFLFTFGLSVLFLAIPFVLFFVILFGVIIGWLLGGAVTFIIAKLLGGIGKFKSQLALFGTIEASFLLLQIPLTLLGIIPCVGNLVNLLIVVLSVYQLFVSFKAIMALHKLSSGRALVVVLAPIALMLALIVLAFLVAFFAPVLIAGFFTFTKVAGPTPVPTPGA